MQSIKDADLYDTTQMKWGLKNTTNIDSDNCDELIAHEDLNQLNMAPISNKFISNTHPKINSGSNLNIFSSRYPEYSGL